MVRLDVPYRPYRAPKGHAQALIEPAIDRVPGMLAENRAIRDSYGDFFEKLRRTAREQMVNDALEYTSAYRDVQWAKERIGDTEIASHQVIMAGHQPALFHPGVWFKNFVLSHLGKQHGAIPINLVVDNDVAPGCSVRVPVRGDKSRSGQLARTPVPYDLGGGGVPYEQTVIRDRDTFDQFDQQVVQAVSGVVDDPCVTSLWKHARKAVERCGIAGCALAQARHGLEGELGLETLELPLGVLCRGPAFASFLLAILTDLARFQSCYNQCADHYRQAHKIRSSAHPVPNLSQDGEWFEAPLWIYGNDDSKRRSAWAKCVDGKLFLTDAIDESTKPPGTRRREMVIDIEHPGLAAQQLASRSHPDFKVRPRALITTMYSRLVLSDLFVHGIGGGKYDQLGDQIIREFFAVEPPQFMVISATVHLPRWDLVRHSTETDQSSHGDAASGQESQSPESVRDIKRKLRDLDFQPERFADHATLDPGLLARKKAILGQGKPAKTPRCSPSEVSSPGSGFSAAATSPAKVWHDELAEINAVLSSSLDSVREKLEEGLRLAYRREAGKQLLESREHPFCVFPLNYVVDAMRGMLPDLSDQNL